MKSVIRAGVRVVGGRAIFGLLALVATACVEGDPIPQDVIQRAEGVLLEGVTTAAPVAPASTSAAASDSVAPAASGSGFAANGIAPVLPEVSDLGAAELDEDAIPEDAIPLADWLAQ